ncbi:MAG: hypothetical protein L0H81_08530, partial [Actinomyces sp.]|nr:hypothetical protein [Actinomyces sp.]
MSSDQQRSPGHAGGGAASSTSAHGAPHAPGSWVPDILPGFEQLTLELEPDEQGDVVATLVRPARAAAAGVGAGGGERTDEGDVPDVGVDVLYVHG